MIRASSTATPSATCFSIRVINSLETSFNSLSDRRLKKKKGENIKDVVVLFDYFYYLSTTTMPSLLKVSRRSLVRKEPILVKKKNYSQLIFSTTLGSLTYDCAARDCRPRWPQRWFQQRYLLPEVRPGPLPQLLQVV